MADTQSPELQAPQMGDQLGPYRLQELLAIGGMGLVFKAYEAALDRCVAVKVLAPHAARNPAVAQRFLEEARAAANLNHPNIVHVYTAGQQQGVFYIAMELVVGQSLETLLGHHQRLHVREAIELVRQAALGLQHAHQNGIVHGDVKPGNLMLGEDVTIKVTDFGLARQLNAAAPHPGGGELFGTPEYVAPEMIEGQPGDQRSDIYSLGATLYRLLAGRPPFTGTSSRAILDQHLTGQAASIPELNPNVPAAVAEIAARMMSRDPTARYQDYPELIHALDQYLADRPLVVAPPRASSSSLPSPKRTRRKLLAMVSLSVILALCAAGVWLWHRARPGANSSAPPPPTITAP